MKKPCRRIAALAVLAAQQLAAAIPAAWTNSPGMPPYPLPPYPHGVPVDFAVTLRGYSDPPAEPGADVRLWFQTNGMGREWWSAPATLEGDVIKASFTPGCDTGADRVSLFFGAPSNVFAAAVLRLVHSPGFAPASLPLPAKTLDFAEVELRNIFALTNGWSFGSVPGDYAAVSNRAMAAVQPGDLGSFAATGAVRRLRNEDYNATLEFSGMADMDHWRANTPYDENLRPLAWLSEVESAIVDATNRAAATAVQRTDEDWATVTNRMRAIAKDVVYGWYFDGTASSALSASTADTAGSATTATTADEAHTARIAQSLHTDDNIHSISFNDYEERWTHTNIRTMSFESLAYLSDVSAAALAATNYVDAAIAAKADASALRYALVDVPAGPGIGALADRSVNSVSTAAAISLILPAAVPGRARDFLVLVTTMADDLSVTFAAYSSAETVSYVTDDGEFPAPGEAGEYLYSFTEVAAGRFAVSMRRVMEVAQ